MGDRSSSKLRLGVGLNLPIDAITDTLGVVGKRGSGKTYAVGVLVEEILRVEQQVVIVDPTDSWWGLRSSADGLRPGLPVTVLGGEHADLPLDEKDAAAVADLVVEHGPSVVLCVEHMSKAAQRRCVGDFCRRLYARNREPLHVVLDEADIFAPQTLRRDDEGATRCFVAIDQMVRRGRKKGLGVTLATQRPAVLHKDVLTQVSALIAMRLVSPQDVDAVQRWIRYQADASKEREVLAALPRLKTGETIVWSPELLGGLVRAHPESMSRSDLSERAEVRGGTFNEYLSRLKSRGLVVVDHGQVVASDVLFRVA